MGWGDYGHMDPFEEEELEPFGPDAPSETPMGMNIPADDADAGDIIGADGSEAVIEASPTATDFEDSGLDITTPGTDPWGEGAYQEPPQQEGTGNLWGSTSQSKITGTQGEGNVGDETYLEPYIRNLIEENRGLDQAEIAGSQWDAATEGLQQSLGQYDPAKVYGAGNFAGATIDPLATFGGATAGNITPFQGAKVWSPEEQQARYGQVQAMKQMANLAAGGQSQALNLQREQAARERMAMMASTRGAPAAAVLRQGAKMAEGQERQLAQAAAEQQLGAQQGLAQVAGGLRGQDIGLASTRAGFQQEAGMLSGQQRQQIEMVNTQMRHEAGMNRMNAFNQRAAQQAQLLQQSGEASADRKTQVAIQNAAFVNEAERMTFQSDQQRQLKMAEFQQASNMSNAEMEQAGQIAEAQVNAQLEQTRGQLINSLVGQGVDRYKAELQADTEVQMQYNDLLYKYFAVRQGAVVELGKELMNQGWFWQDSTDVLQSKLQNMRLLTGMAAPYGGGGSYDVAAGIGTYPWSHGSYEWGGWGTGGGGGGSTTDAGEWGGEGGSANEGAGGYGGGGSGGGGSERDDDYYE